MTLFISWFSAESLRLLALSLLHFLWQGAALGALAYVVMALCRNAATRYTVGVATLALMLAAPAATYLVIRSQERADSPAMSAGMKRDSASAATAQVFAPAKNATIHRASKSAPPYFPWLVEFWFAGVVLLSLRSAGGILLVERLRRRETLPVTQELLKICVDLQRRMGLTRAVRYCESLHLDAPAVAGWIRPVVLLPVSALTGLSDAQLEAVIAHELAHIRRHDAFVNLFQVGVETLLFYHPAVWWMGKRVRVEREHCCDDAAVAACGSPVTYAHALTRMAEGKVAPQLAMAANRSPLVERIARLLGASSTTETVQGANLSAGVLCLSAALLAGSAFVGSVHYAHAQTPAPAPAPARLAHIAPVPSANGIIHASNPSPVPIPLPAATIAEARASARPLASGTAHVLAFALPAPAISWTGAGQEKTAQSESSKQSYIDSMNAAGLTNLSVDELITLKTQGITAEYVKEMKEYVQTKNGQRGTLDVDALIGMKVQGITADYVKGMKSAIGQNLDADKLIGLKVQGVTPEYVRQMHDLGVKTDPDNLIGMKVQGVTPEYLREMQGLGLKLDSDELIGMKVQGVTPEYVKSFNDLGFHPTSDELIGMKVQGVDAAYLKALQAAGFKVDIDEAIGAKVQGVTPEFIAMVRSHGFKDLTLDKLIALKQTGVLDAEK